MNQFRQWLLDLIPFRPPRDRSNEHLALRTTDNEERGRLVLVGDGSIATIELYRQILTNVTGVDSIDLALGASYYSNASCSNIALNANYLLARAGDVETFQYVQKLQALGIPYAYAIDDNFWMLIDDEHTHPVHQLYRHPLVRRSLEYAIVKADVVLCHSEHFRQFLLAFNANVVVVPTAFDFSLVGSQRKSSPKTEKRIGIVANSTRSKDMAILVPVVQRILKTRHDAVFEFFGYVPNELKGQARVRFLPAINTYADYIKEKMSRGWLVGLAPLVDNRFAEYKTNNKVREYGACSVAGIYSDTPLYRDSVQNGTTGWLVPNETEAWVDTLNAALDQEEQTQAMGQHAREWVQKHHSFENVAKEWRDALQPTFQKRAARVPEMVLRREQLIQWEAEQIDWPQIIGSGGAMKKDAPGESEDFFRRDVLLMLKPGESARAGLLAPLVGPYYWGMQVATFNRQLIGELRIDIYCGDQLIQTNRHDLANVADGSVIEVRCLVNELGRINMVVTNSGSDALCFYGVSTVNSTTFQATDFTYSRGIAA